MRPGVLAGGVRYPVFVPPVLGDTAAYGAGLPSTLVNPWYTACELSKNCIVVSSLAGGDEEWQRCMVQFQYNATGSLVQGVPPECLLEGKRPNQRRFDFGFSALASQSGMLQQLLPWMRLKGASEVLLYFTQSPSYRTAVVESTIAILRSNGFRTPAGTTDDFESLPSIQWDAAAADTEALRIISWNPEVLIFVGSSLDDRDTQSVYLLLSSLWRRGWTPRGALSIVGGIGPRVSSLLETAFPGEGAAAYFYDTTPNHVLLRNPNYNARASDLQWEPFPSVNNTYSPMVFYEEYVKEWGETVPKSLLSGYSAGQLSILNVLIPCQLFFAAGTDDPHAMQLASFSLSLPSASGLIQFDKYGRISQTDQFVTQQGWDGHSTILVTPIDVGQADVFPMPSQAERRSPLQGSAVFLGRSSEHVMVALTAIGMGFLACLLLGVYIFRKASIMKAAAPPFLFLMLIGGLTCLSSNFAFSFRAEAAGCAAGPWLLTIGFTCMFAALLSKTCKYFRS
jgi:hypothetical protein